VDSGTLPVVLRAVSGSSLLEALRNTSSDVLVVIGGAEMYNDVRGSKGGVLSAMSSTMS